MRSSRPGGTWPAMLLPCLLLLLVAVQLTCVAPAVAQSDTGRTSGLGNPTESANLLSSIGERTDQKDSLIPVSPLGTVREGMGEVNEGLYNTFGLKFGMVFTHAFQKVTDALPGQDDVGTATTADFLASWDLIDKGGPYMGQAIAHVQGRWNYGTTGPEALGFNSLGSAIGTADTFDEYLPNTFVLRNLTTRPYSIRRFSASAVSSSQSDITTLGKFCQYRIQASGLARKN